MNVVCRNDECPDSITRRRDAPPMRLLSGGETQSAWVFECPRCKKDGRVSMRVCTKDQIGGTFGSGRRDSGLGTSTGKGPSKYRPGVTFTS